LVKVQFQRRLLRHEHFDDSGFVAAVLGLLEKEAPNLAALYRTGLFLLFLYDVILCQGTLDADSLWTLIRQKAVF
jgi:hypothetical protein